MILIEKVDYEKIVKHSLRELPNEACGVIAGYINSERKEIKKVYFLTNTDNSPEHFSLDPKEQFNAMKDMRDNGYEMIGNFHSHPNSKARPSEEDKRLAFDSKISYMILSLEDRDIPVLKSFNIGIDGVREETIEILEDINDYY